MTPESSSAAAYVSLDKVTPGPAPAKTGPAGLQPPLAVRDPVEHVIHNDRRVDHYAWLRDKQNPRVLSYAGLNITRGQWKASNTPFIAGNQRSTRRSRCCWT